MVDWQEVDRLRSKGWDWDRIAADPKVGFRTESSSQDPGRTLRALYYQRKSRQQRKGAPTRKESSEAVAKKERKWTLARFGLLLTPAFGIWFVLAYFYPSPVGVYLPAIPVIGILLAIAAFVLAFGLLRSDKRWTPVFRKTIAYGLALGFAIAGGFAGYSALAGCGVLPSSSTAIGQPSGWEKVTPSAWHVNGAAVFFFYGSAACPYCSASSWAMQYALGRFGTLSGTYFDTSSPTDSPPSVPEVVLSSASINSQYVSLQVAESTNDQSITAPAVTSCIQQAYVSTYNPSGSIPFVVINGQWYHVGTLVDPTVLAGMTPQQVQSEVNSQSGSAWVAISPQAYLMTAILCKANGDQPQSVAQDPNIAPLLAQLS